LKVLEFFSSKFKALKALDVSTDVSLPPHLYFVTALPSKTRTAANIDPTCLIYKQSHVTVISWSNSEKMIKLCAHLPKLVLNQN